MQEGTQLLMTKEEALNYFKDIELKFIIYEDSVFVYKGQKDNNIIQVEYNITSDITSDITYNSTEVLRQDINYKYFNISIEEDGKVLYHFCE